MRIGLIARADRTGLAIQTWTFWKNMFPDATLVVDVGHLMGVHPDLTQFGNDPNVTVWRPEWFPAPYPVREPIIDEFLEKVDVIFSVETFYNTYICERAHRTGKRTVLQPNYEHLVHLGTPDVPEPDVFGLPTDWHEADIRAALPGREIVSLPVPIDRELLPFRERGPLQTILHTCGTVAQPDRNGTAILVEAMRHVKSDVRCRIRSQRPLTHIRNLDPPANVEILDDQPMAEFWKLYGDEEAFVLPRRFGGLCLPMQEALAVGMQVMMSQAPPQEKSCAPIWTAFAKPGEPIQSKAEVETWDTHPHHVAAGIDFMAQGMFAYPPYVLRRWGDEHSWDALRPLYQKVLEG